MAVVSLQAALVGFYDQWEVVGTANKVLAVNQPDDDATSYIRKFTLGQRQSYSLPASGIPLGSTVNSVTVRFRVYAPEGVSGNYVAAFLRLAATDQDGPAKLCDLIWRNYSDVIARPGGGVWALVDLLTLEIGVVVTGVNWWVWVTTLFVDIDYTLPAAGNGSGAVFGTRPLYPRGRRIVHN